jgi:cell wall-associated NlpC family hydrolase
VTFPRRRRRSAFLVLVCLLAVLAPSSTGAASADPIADKKAEAERIAARLREEGERTSILAEQVNDAKIKADEVAAQTAAAESALAKTDAEVLAARQRLRTQAVAAYVHGGQASTLEMLVAGDGSDLVVRRSYVDAVSTKEREALDGIRQAKQGLEEKRASLRAAQTSAKDALGRLESARAAAARSAAMQEATLATVQGELGTLVAAERQRLAEEEAQRAEAELKVRQARIEAARLAQEEASRRRAAATTTTDAPARRAETPALTSPRTPSGGGGPTTTTTRPPQGGSGSGSGGSASPPRPPAAGADAAIAEARRQIGKPYEYGASGPDSFDCSGLTSWAWRAGGKSLPHSSKAQYSTTSRVALDELQPGDLVFYGSPIHHVGLFIGNGQMIEASTTGTPVRYASIYRRDYVGGGRVG